MNRLEYLNLELSQSSRIVTSLDNNSIKCCFYRESVNHIFHSSNSQLNVLVDLVTNLGKNLEINQNKNSHHWQYIHDLLIKKDRAIHNLENKLEYLKTTFSFLEEKLVSFDKKYNFLVNSQAISKDSISQEKVLAVLEKSQDQFEKIKFHLEQIEKLVRS